MRKRCQRCHQVFLASSAGARTCGFCLRESVDVARARRAAHPISSALRQLVFTATPLCCYCGGLPAPGDKELDHMLPISRGGTSEITNLATACGSCNRSKGSRTEEEYGRLIDPTLYVWLDARFPVTA